MNKHQHKCIKFLSLLLVILVLKSTCLTSRKTRFLTLNVFTIYLFLSFYFHPSVFLKCIYCKQHIVGSWLALYHLSPLTGMSHPFIFNMVADTAGLKCIILLFLFSFFTVFLFPFRPLSCFLLE